MGSTRPTLGLRGNGGVKRSRIHSGIECRKAAVPAGWYTRAGPTVMGAPPPPPSPDSRDIVRQDHLIIQHATILPVPPSSTHRSPPPSQMPRRGCPGSHAHHAHHPSAVQLCQRPLPQPQFPLHLAHRPAPALHLDQRPRDRARVDERAAGKALAPGVLALDLPPLLQRLARLERRNRGVGRRGEGAGRRRTTCCCRRGGARSLRACSGG
jgi:hypothetical protein